MKYRFISDPGHAWLEVPRAELVALGVMGQVSSYSYQRGGSVYLEEDCDAALFIDAKGLTKDDWVNVYESVTLIRGFERVNGDSQ